MCFEVPFEGDFPEGFVNTFIYVEGFFPNSFVLVSLYMYIIKMFAYLVRCLNHRWNQHRLMLKPNTKNFVKI